MLTEEQQKALDEKIAAIRARYKKKYPDGNIPKAKLPELTPVTTAPKGTVVA
jgi:hypothetical protein